MRFAKTIASASVAAVLGLAGVSVAGAASSGGSPAAPPTTAAAPGRSAVTSPQARSRRAAIRRRRIRRACVLAAKTIGIKPVDLAKELRAGKTIAQVATEHGVQPQTVVNAIEQAAKARIDKARDAGKITADRAARLEQRVDRIVPRFVDTWHLKHPRPAA